jgi:hypothetical protein
MSLDIQKGCVERWCAVLKEVDCKYGSNPPMGILGAIRPLLYSAPWPLLQKGRAENIPRPYHIMPETISLTRPHELHHRCSYLSKAASRFILTKKEGFRLSIPFTLDALMSFE